MSAPSRAEMNSSKVTKSRLSWTSTGRWGNASNRAICGVGSSRFLFRGWVPSMEALRGGAAHRLYSVIVFIVLASLDNVTISLVPTLYTPISRGLGVGEGYISLVTGVSYLVSA